MNDTRTLEQVISDAIYEWSHRAYDNGTQTAGMFQFVSWLSLSFIAEAVRKWMLDTPGAVFHARIKELEEEVERLKSSASLEKMQRDASAYRDLRERFPFLPGEEFYATVSSKRLILNVGDPIPELIIYKRTVNLVGVNGVLDTKDNTWNWDECHPTADACRAAVPVEE